MGLKLFHGDARMAESAVGVADRAIDFAFAAIDFCAAAVWITVHRHSAALAIFGHEARPLVFNSQKQ